MECEAVLDVQPERLQPKATMVEVRVVLQGADFAITGASLHSLHTSLLRLWRDSQARPGLEVGFRHRRSTS